MSSGIAFAQALPGPADIERINPEQRQLTVPPPENVPSLGGAPVPAMPVPAAAAQIRFTLNDVHFENVTVYKDADLRALYAPYLHKTVTLDVIYKMAATLTARYRADGYFLSLAYVPNQKIQGGIVTIRGVEGYVGRINFSDEQRNNYVIRDYCNRLVAQRPLTAAQMESFLLRLNSLPGYSFRAVLSPLESEGDGAVKLTLIPTTPGGHGLITFDNYSSRYLGPHEASASYTQSFLPLTQTSVSGLGAVPPKRLRYTTFDQTVVVIPDVTLDLSANITKAHPGYTLEPFDIYSESTFLSGGLTYNWIRQRDEALDLRASIDARNSDSDFLSTPFTRDRIRALRLNATYNRTDPWLGANLASFTLSQGLDVPGSSKSDDLFVSRAGARPDFTKFEISLSRLQGLPYDLSLQTAADMQWSPRPLYAAEEFGYGGQAFGRAYDSSEITGNSGVAGSLEFRYDHFAAASPVGVQPYTFYDIGRVWNDVTGQPPRASGSSAGFGLRTSFPYAFSGNAALAWPLTRQIDVPVYVRSRTGPRILFELSRAFN